MKNKILILLICLLSWPSLAGAETDWRALSAARAKSYGQMMADNLSYSHNRSQKVYDDVVLKARQQGSLSNNNVKINNSLTEIKNQLDKNQADITELKTKLNSSTSTLDWAATKKSVRGIIQDLRQIHGKIKKVLELLD